MAVLTGLGTVALLLYGISSLASLFASDGKIWDNEWRLKWSSDRPGYWWHVMAASTEWTLANVFSLIWVCLSVRMKQFAHWNDVAFSI